MSAMVTDKLAKLLNTQLRAGTFTHVYASCGLLTEAQPRSVFTHLPASRRVFDLASITKPLVTLPLYIEALLTNELPRDTTLATLLRDSPHQLVEALAGLRVEELLCHRSGLPAWRNLWIGVLGSGRTLTPAETIALLNRSAEHLHTGQGSTHKPVCYSDLNFILAALCLEIFRKKQLDVLFAEFWRAALRFQPRHFFGFCPPAAANAVPHAYCRIRERLLQGEVHDENCAALGGVSGHAGLFASGDDLVAYLRALYTHKIGQEIVARNQQLLATTSATCLLGMQRGAKGVLSAHGNLIGHLGFTGTSFWLDPARRHYTVLLTNRTIKARLVKDFHHLRQQVSAVLQEQLDS